MTNQMESAFPNSSTPPMPTGAGGAGNGQPTSPSQVTFTAEQVEYLRPFIEQQAQSLKDRRFAELEKAVNELRNGQPRQTEPAGQPPAQAQAVSLANGTPQAAQSESVDFLAIYQAVGVNPNDNRVLHLTAQHANDPKALSAALVEHKIGLGKQPPAPVAALPASQNGFANGGKPDISTIKDPKELMRIAREGNVRLPGRNG